MTFVPFQDGFRIVRRMEWPRKSMGWPDARRLVLPFLIGQVQIVPKRKNPVSRGVSPAMKPPFVRGERIP